MRVSFTCGAGEPCAISLAFLIAAVVGFAMGQANVGMLLGLPLPHIGQVYIVEASLFAWLAMIGSAGTALRPAAVKRSTDSRTGCGGAYRRGHDPVSSRLAPPLQRIADDELQRERYSDVERNGTRHSHHHRRHTIHRPRRAHRGTHLADMAAGLHDPDRNQAADRRYAGNRQHRARHDHLRHRPCRCARHTRFAAKPVAGVAPSRRLPATSTAGSTAARRAAPGRASTSDI